MKVLMLNSSPKANGNTANALMEIGKVLEAEGVEYEIFNMGGKPVRDCIGCGQCTEKGCVFDDDICNEFIAKAKEADGFVFGTPVYYAHPTGRIFDILDRAFYSSGDAFAGKPGAAISVARRGGTVASNDSLQKYFGITNMPIVTSTYWNQSYGRTPGETVQDEEGMQTMRNIGHNMAWLLKCIELGKQAGITPQIEYGKATHFIR